MEVERIVEQKKLLDLAMDFYFLNGVTSGADSESAEIAVRAGYDMFFGENASVGKSEQDLIRNALDCYENLITLVCAAKKQGYVEEFTLDELIIKQKRVLNIAKELSFISGAKKAGKCVTLNEGYLKKDFESIFGKGSSQKKTYSKMAGEVLAYLESKNYAVENTSASEQTRV